MTKDQELAIIDQTIAQLGARSYLGPWLTSIRPELEATIRSDYFPAPILPAEAERRARQIIEDANAQAAETRERATVEAERLRANAHATADTIRARARRQLEQIAGEL